MNPRRGCPSLLSNAAANLIASVSCLHSLRAFPPERRTRVVRYIGIASLLTCISLSAPSLADETLNLQLPSSHPSSGASSSPSAGPTERPGSTESKQFEDYI